MTSSRSSPRTHWIDSSRCRGAPRPTGTGCRRPRTRRPASPRRGRRRSGRRRGGRSWRWRWPAPRGGGSRRSTRASRTAPARWSQRERRVASRRPRGTSSPTVRRVEVVPDRDPVEAHVLDAPPQVPQLVDRRPRGAGVHSEGGGHDDSRARGGPEATADTRAAAPLPSHRMTVRVGLLGTGFIARYHAMQLGLADEPSELGGGVRPRPCTSGVLRHGPWRRRPRRRRRRRRRRAGRDSDAVFVCTWTVGPPGVGASGRRGRGAGLLREAAVDRPGLGARAGPSRRASRVCPTWSGWCCDRRRRCSTLRELVRRPEPVRS